MSIISIMYWSRHGDRTRTRVVSGIDQRSYPLSTVSDMVSIKVGSLYKPSYSKESLATVAMLMTIIITRKVTVTKCLAVFKVSLL